MPGVTKEQIQAAREADLFTYLQFHEPGVLKRDGPNFRHKEHDSLVYVTGKRYRLSLGGTSHVALTSFLERHPEIRRVTLYMDRDLAGFVNARKIKTMLHEDKRFRHIRVSVNPPRMGKDYNEKLLQVREQLQTSQHQRRPKEAAVSI